MTCKNCHQTIADDVNYCSHCGAPVVHERLTVKGILKSFIDDYLGIDNKYFRTIKALVLFPQRLFQEYFDGTRKKYVAPVAFLAIGLAIAIIVFNQFEEKYLEMAVQLNEQRFEDQIANEDDVEKIERYQSELKLNETIQRSILKYYNLFTFLSLPFYGLIAFLVFGKPCNYAEHLVIAAYLQGFLLLVSVFLFLLSLITNPGIYSLGSLPVSFILYLYAYGKLYQLSLGKLFLKFLKFLIILALVFVVIVLIGVAIGFVAKMLDMPLFETN